mgnify:CR=1 FL=1
MAGPVLIVIALVLVLPISVLLSGAVLAGLLGWSIESEGDAEHEGSELLELNVCPSPLLPRLSRVGVPRTFRAPGARGGYGGSRYTNPAGTSHAVGRPRNTERGSVCQPVP